jgi:flagellar motor component MotA
MASMNITKAILMIPTWILILAIVALGVVQSGRPVNLIDPAGLLFVLVFGIALVMISFPGSEIRRALRDSMASPGNETDIKRSACLWEAAGRSFWIAGVLRSILNFVMFFMSLRTQPIAAPQVINKGLAQYLLVTLYGILLAVICFIPYWKLTGKLLGRPSVPAAEQTSMASKCSFWRLGTVAGYILIVSLWLWSWPLHSIELLIAIKPAVFVVLGGMIAMTLFMRGSGPTLSTSFAAMGLIGSLLGIIQMLFGMTEGMKGIPQVAGALAFFLASCLTALLGMALVGAPVEDRAIRIGRIPSPSAFSRVAWYVFPLLALVTLIPLAFQLIQPLITVR